MLLGKGRQGPYDCERHETKNWPRVLRKDYIARDFALDGIRGQASLSILRGLTAPLTVHYPFGDVLIVDTDYRWLQVAVKGQYFWITAMYNREDELVNLYFDITNGNCFDDPENPCFEDLYLDIVAAEGHLLILDQEELAEALKARKITWEQYHHAEQVCGKLFAYLQENPEKVTAFCWQTYQKLKALMNAAT